jgi:hypothetical protein
MGENIHESIKKLSLTIAADSYPVLKNLKYFRDYNNYINNSLKRDISLLDDNNQKNENEPRQLTIEMLTYLSEVKKYYAFANIMRVSLLTSLCAFVEMVIITPCHTFDSDSSYTNFQRHKYPKKRKPSAIQIAKEFLVSKGVSGLNDIPNWEYIFDMMKIRNCFVHGNGKSNKNIMNMSGLYNIEIIEGNIVLGEDFLNNFIGVLEVFSVSYARLLYTDQGYTKKFIDKYGSVAHQFLASIEEFNLAFQRKELG